MAKLSKENYELYLDVKVLADKIVYAMDTAVEDSYVDELIKLIYSKQPYPYNQGHEDG